MTNLTQPIQKVIENLSAMYPWEAETFRKLVEVCYQSGQLDQMKRTQMELAQRLNPTIPDNADLWQEGQPESVIL